MPEPTKLARFTIRPAATRPHRPVCPRQTAGRLDAIPAPRSRCRSPRRLQALFVSAMVLLDAQENEEYKEWLADILVRGTRVVVPEIPDYEVRRDLLCGESTRQLCLFE